MKQKLWCCVGLNFTTPYYDWTSLSYARKDSINEFVNGSNITWEECKRIGWRCVQVEVTIKSINKLK